ncbi:MAG: phosphotransferase [Kiritimatiellae bacterium]|nr:phosphotransferase [Kiritimatiellia bacterium]
MAPAQRDTPAPEDVLRDYEIGRIRAIRAGGGTAGKTWRVETSTGGYFLRLRGTRTSGDARLRYDHGLREHLAAQGVPTATAVRARDGARWVRAAGRVCELYPFIRGRAFRAGAAGEIANAAHALARFHEVAAAYKPPIQAGEPIAQYTTLGFSDAVSDRLEDPGLQLTNLQALHRLAAGAGERANVEWAIGRVERLTEVYAGPAYSRLSGWVVHGDYTPANLLFSERGDVCGIFDLDWAYPGARCRDVADGLYFFAAQPRAIDPGNIWSLTDAAEFDAAGCRTFLAAYQESAALKAEELDAVPAAFAGRWFSIRLEGMAKVPEDERLRFFARDIRKPVEWLDANWGEVRG